MTAPAYAISVTTFLTRFNTVLIDASRVTKGTWAKTVKAEQNSKVGSPDQKCYF
jgi:hypothetical protein